MLLFLIHSPDGRIRAKYIGVLNNELLNCGNVYVLLRLYHALMTGSLPFSGLLSS